MLEKNNNKETDVSYLDKDEFQQKIDPLNSFN